MEKERSFGRILQDIFTSILIALFIAVMLKVFFIGSAIIISPSMEKTLMVNDHVLVWKFLYNRKIPVINKSFFIGFPVKRNHIIVFKREGHEDDYVKRVIGLPGDKIEFKGSRVFLNNKLLDEPYVNNKSIVRYRSYSIKIPENQVFVMGDNRNDSKDSRDFGCISIDNIVGKVFFIFYPFKRMKFF
jgi:signal peptidase I